MSTSADSQRIPVQQLDVPLAREGFMVDVIRELSGMLQDVIGLEDAEGLVRIVGQNIGMRIHSDYLHAASQKQLQPNQISEVLIDLKERISGDFYLIEQTSDRIVLGNRRCPFGESVLNRPSLCMMTSAVFGTIASETTGYARVTLEETIARGDSGCRVIVDLNPDTGTSDSSSKEYFGTPY